MQDPENDLVTIVDILYWVLAQVGMLMVGNLIKLAYVRTEMHGFVAFIRSHMCQMIVVTNDT